MTSLRLRLARAFRGFVPCMSVSGRESRRLLSASVSIPKSLMPSSWPTHFQGSLFTAREAAQPGRGRQSRPTMPEARRMPAVVIHREMAVAVVSLDLTSGHMGKHRARRRMSTCWYGNDVSRGRSRLSEGLTFLKGDLPLTVAVRLVFGFCDETSRQRSTGRRPT